jgi:hypothetical protein
MSLLRRYVTRPTATRSTIEYTLAATAMMLLAVVVLPA